MMAISMRFRLAPSPMPWKSRKLADFRSGASIGAQRSKEIARGARQATGSPVA